MKNKNKNKKQQTTRRQKMPKVSYKQAKEWVDNKDYSFSEKDLGNLIANGEVSQPRTYKSSKPMVVEVNGSRYELQPTLYFKGGSEVGTDTKEMSELREKVYKVVEKYRSTKNGVVADSDSSES